MWMVVAYAQAPDEHPDYRGYVDQARFFLKRGWTRDAAEQLELAVATPDGALDPEAWFLLAQVRYDQSDLDGARRAADRALVHSRDDATARQTRELLDFISQRFGFVVIRGPHEATASLLHVELTSTLFDPDLRTFTVRLQERLASEPQVLPATVGLPAGSWEINGRPVQIGAGGEVALDVPLVGTRSALLQTLQLELGMGFSSWLGPRAAHLTPAPAAQLSLSVPVGPVVTGLVVDWIPALFEAPDGTRGVQALGFAAGARVGFELPNTAPMVFRPSAGWRMGRLTGVQAACRADGTCGDVPADLYVVGPATAQLPFVELAAYYQDRRRRASWGAGIKGVGELALAQRPREQTARTLDGRELALSSPEARGWTAPGIRVLAELSFAF